MFGASRNEEQLRSELDYLREYIPRVFGRVLEQEAFSAQVDEMVTEKIRDYIYQRYRDWTAPELSRLRDAWTNPEQSTQEMTAEVTAPRRGRPPKNLVQA